MRGAFWPLKVEDIDLPKEGMEPAPMERSSEVARLFFEHKETLMMDPGGKANLEETYYNDPVLEDPTWRKRRSTIMPASCKKEAAVAAAETPGRTMKVVKLWGKAMSRSLWLYRLRSLRELVRN